MAGSSGSECRVGGRSIVPGVGVVPWDWLEAARTMAVAEGFNGVVGVGLDTSDESAEVFPLFGGSGRPERRSSVDDVAGLGRFFAAAAAATAGGGVPSTLRALSSFKASLADFEGRDNNSFARFAFAFFSLNVKMREGLSSMAGFEIVSGGGAATVMVFLALLGESDDWLLFGSLPPGFFFTISSKAASTKGGRVGDMSGGNVLFFFCGDGPSGFLDAGGGGAFSANFFRGFCLSSGS